MGNEVYALHVAENGRGYERVKVLANRVNEKNNLAVIEKNGEIFYTGGYLFSDTSTLYKLFDKIPKCKHYEFATLLRTKPFVKDYFEKD